MVERREEELLAACFQEVTGSPPSSITPLRPHASARRIYRIASPTQKLIGVINHGQGENDAFVALAQHFLSLGLPVPKIHAYKPEVGLYLEDDLGDQTLLDFLTTERAQSNESFPPRVEETYTKVLSYLPRFQIEAARTLDFEKTLGTHPTFTTLLAKDMLSFSSELLARLIPAFDSNSLSNDFDALIKLISKAKSDYFLYRDFQSRNIMLVDGEPVFIDFQSGLRGPLQYDVVSLLYQSSAQIPETNRERLVIRYLDFVRSYTPCDSSEFFHTYSAFVVARMIQVLGVYGREGIGAKKEYFFKSIPAALHTLRHHLSAREMPIKLENLLACTDGLLESLTP